MYLTPPLYNFVDMRPLFFFLLRTPAFQQVCCFEKNPVGSSEVFSDIHYEVHSFHSGLLRLQHYAKKPECQAKTRLDKVLMLGFIHNVAIYKASKIVTCANVLQNKHERRRGTPTL